MVGGFGCAAIVIIFLLLPFIGFFVPLGYVCYFFAWFSGFATLLFGSSALYCFDVTDLDDWKTLAFSLLIPGAITALLIGLGNLFGEHYIFEIVEMIF